MKKNGFTLVELIAVIILLCVTVTIVIVKIENNIKNANSIGNEMKVEYIESAALVYAEDYRNELTNIESKNVDTVTINDLINKGLVENKNLEDINTTDIVLIAEINGILKVKYTGSLVNVIFLNGSKDISIYQGDSYTEMGAYVAIPNTGLIELSSSNISSSVNSSSKGTYKVTYSYSNATSVIRNVTVL